MPHADPHKRILWNKDYVNRNRDKINEQSRKRYAANLEKARAKGRRDAIASRPRRRKYLRLRRYGITPQEFDALLVVQDGKCGICRRPLESERPKATHVDHCHESTKVRGILCARCNMGMAMLGDGKLFQDAIDYLRNPPADKVADIHKPKPNAPSTARGSSRPTKAAGASPS